MGAAACSDEAISQKRINKHASIFTAEATALNMALNQIENSPKRSFIIFSDSLSCLESLEHFNISDTRILRIIEKVNCLAQQKQIIFAWIPGHVNIRGNDRADGLAKESLGLELPDHAPIPHTDYRSHVNTRVSNIWKNHWKNLCTNKLKKIQPEIKPRKKVTTTRSIETMLTRLRIGHTFFTHAYLLQGEPPPFCVGCNQEMSIEHLLIHCTDFSDIRKKYFRCRTLKMLFEIVDEMKIVNFVREIGLIRRL